MPKLEGERADGQAFSGKRARLGCIGASVCPLTRSCGGRVEEVSQRDGCIWVFQSRPTRAPPPDDGDDDDSSSKQQEMEQQRQRQRQLYSSSGSVLPDLCPRILLVVTPLGCAPSLSSPPFGPPPFFPIWFTAAPPPPLFLPPYLLVRPPLFYEPAGCSCWLLCVLLAAAPPGPNTAFVAWPWPSRYRSTQGLSVAAATRDRCDHVCGGYTEQQGCRQSRPQLAPEPISALCWPAALPHFCARRCALLVLARHPTHARRHARVHAHGLALIHPVSTMGTASLGPGGGGRKDWETERGGLWGVTVQLRPRLLGC